MCFSPEADLAAGVVLGALAIDALRRHPCRSDLPLAALPAVLAAHSLIEALVWYAGRGNIDEAIGTAATYAYLLIAFVVLPTLVPLAIRLREPKNSHHRALTGLVVLGAVVSSVLFAVLVTSPVTATLETHFVRYHTQIPFAAVIVTGYVIATCGPGLLSSARTIQVFAGLNLVAVGVLALVNTAGLTSLWCGWAVVTSVAVVIQIRRDESLREALPEKAISDQT